MNKRIKLSKYAELMGIHYQTAFLWWKQGKIDGAYKTESGSVMVELREESKQDKSIAIYARVSSHNKKDDLERQVQRCLDFCASQGLIVEKVYKEVASGMNDNRKQLWNMLDKNHTIIVVENKDRLTRFGFNYISRLCEKSNCKIVVINSESNDQDDIMKDMISIITSFCCRLYGARRAINKKHRIMEAIKE